MQTSLEERLALSESLGNKNNDAIHSISEQLLKANQIISKQNSDLIEMKEKVTNYKYFFNCFIRILYCPIHNICITIICNIVHYF